MSQNTTSVRDQLKALENLQEFDLKIDVLKRQMAEMPAALKTAQEKMAQIRLQIAAKETTIEEIGKAQRECKAAQELTQDRLNRANAKLASVANDHEYQAATKEIDQLKKHAEQLVQQYEKGTADGSKIQTEIATLQERVAAAQAECDAHSAKIAAEMGRLETELGRVMQERTPMTSSIERRILAQYDRVRPARAGLGIVPVLAGRCKGCNMSLPPQLSNEVQRATAFHQCPSCNRLLFSPQA